MNILLGIIAIWLLVIIILLIIILAQTHAIDKRTSLIYKQVYDPVIGITYDMANNFRRESGKKEIKDL